MAEKNQKVDAVRHAGSWLAIVYVAIKVLQVIYEFLAGAA